MRRVNPTRSLIRPTFAFKRDLLPTPGPYYREQGLNLMDGGAWKSALCPFHLNTTPSLQARVETGTFRCMIYGVHGGYVYDLYFIEAAQLRLRVVGR